MIKTGKYPNLLTRRSALRAGLGTMLAAIPAVQIWADVLAELSAKAMVTIENFSVAGKSTGVVRVAKVVKSDAEWSKKLTADVFQVTRRAVADHSYTGSYWNSRADGLYKCICCDIALFDSRSKFESGTGWPSFMQPVSALNVSIAADSISCSLCDAHLGHVFKDGPDLSGLRYSPNSLALNFAARNPPSAKS